MGFSARKRNEEMKRDERRQKGEPEVSLKVKDSKHGGVLNRPAQLELKGGGKVLRSRCEDAR